MLDKNLTTRYKFAIQSFLEGIKKEEHSQEDTLNLLLRTNLSHSSAVDDQATRFTINKKMMG